jgi:hypothetical protein
LFARAVFHVKAPIFISSKNVNLRTLGAVVASLVVTVLILVRVEAAAVVATGPAVLRGTVTVVVCFVVVVCWSLAVTEEGSGTTVDEAFDSFDVDWLTMAVFVKVAYDCPSVCL